MERSVRESLKFLTPGRARVNESLTIPLKYQISLEFPGSYPRGCVTDRVGSAEPPRDRNSALTGVGAEPWGDQLRCGDGHGRKPGDGGQTLRRDRFRADHYVDCERSARSEALDRSPTTCHTSELTLSFAYGPLSRLASAEPTIENLGTVIFASPVRQLRDDCCRARDVFRRSVVEARPNIRSRTRVECCSFVW